MPRRTFSVQHRQFHANLIFVRGLPAMRPYSYCTSRDFICVVSDASDYCERCYRANRRCELAPPTAEMERIMEQDRQMSEKLVEAESRAIRLRKQRRALRKKLRDLS